MRPTFTTGEGTTFQLRIDLGNDAMREPAHVSEKQREIASRLERGEIGSWKTILDENGNDVGRYLYPEVIR